MFSHSDLDEFYPVIYSYVCSLHVKEALSHPCQARIILILLQLNNVCYEVLRYNSDMRRLLKFRSVNGTIWSSAGKQSVYSGPWFQVIDVRSMPS